VKYQVLNFKDATHFMFVNS